MASKKRARFVIELDGRIALEKNIWSEGLRSAMAVQTKMLELLSFDPALSGEDAWQAARRKWGTYLVPCTAESRGVLEKIEVASVISIKIAPHPVRPAYTEVLITFRRHRKAIGSVRLVFSEDGEFACGSSGGV